MINYIELIGNNYPTTQVYTMGSVDDYNSIIWDSPVVAKADLDALYLTEIKTNKIVDFSKIAQSEITAGFKSSALGTQHIYDSAIEDQLNLIGAVSTQVDMLFSCRPSTQGKQTVNFNNSWLNTNNTGLQNNNTTYTSQILIDGVTFNISIVGSSSQTMDTIITQILNTSNFSSVADIVVADGNFTIISKTYGVQSTVSIINNNLFTGLTVFGGILPAINGVDASPKVYKVHTHAQLLTLINDGKNVKLTILQKFLSKKNLILAASTEADVNNISWS